jgi:hypothetical protein
MVSPPTPMKPLRGNTVPTATQDLTKCRYCKRTIDGKKLKMGCPPYSRETRAWATCKPCRDGAVIRCDVCGVPKASKRAKCGCVMSKLVAVR